MRGIISIEMVTCTRPHCDEEATAYIPLPEGSRRSKVFVCARHEREARQACYYVVPVDGLESEEGFYKAIRAKHQRIRGSDSLKFAPLRLRRQSDPYAR